MARVGVHLLAPWVGTGGPAVRGLCWVLGQFRLEAKEADCLLYFSSAAGLREFLSLLEKTDGAGTHGPCPIHSQLHAWHELRVTAS